MGRGWEKRPPCCAQMGNSEIVRFGREMNEMGVFLHFWGVVGGGPLWLLGWAIAVYMWLHVPPQLLSDFLQIAYTGYGVIVSNYVGAFDTVLLASLAKSGFALVYV